METFTPEVCKKLRNYVYLYIDPITDEVFYVGKGRDNRAFFHLNDTSESDKCARIGAIRKANREPQIELLAHGLDERTARQLEASAIDLLEQRKLTNAVRGWKAGVYGRMTIQQVRALYSAVEVRINHPCVLIRINELFRYGMTPIELYDATRGVWRIGPAREHARYAFAVFDGVVQEVYEIAHWFPGGSTMSTRPEGDKDDRWEFVGRLARESIRRRYCFKAVRNYFPPGAQNPIRYVGLQESAADGPIR